MIALDASVLIALLRSDDRHHLGARQVLAAHRVSVVHAVNLAEALVAPARAGRERIALRAWNAVGVSELTRVADEALTLARLRVETRLKLPECCVVLAAEHAGGVLATFDDRLATAARARGIEVLDGDG